MSIIDVYNINGEKVSQLELAESIFNVPVKQSVLHEVVTMQLACRRAGSASVKHRSDVKGSTRKLYKQKGTGRARRGDIKSPLLRGGGSIFGPDPRSYSYKVPKKIRKQALKMALSSKIQTNNLLVLDKFELEKARTKGFTSVLDNLKVKKALIITENVNENLELSSRNVPGIKVMRYEGLNVYDILKYEKLILLETSIKGIEGRLTA
ncbi:MAG: 50S ribosomal protein L4 [Proteobacteria bacterium]|nr:50S ribosomal protein L4 [Pseudomonadota bacterium]OQW98676.1 MAG: 50S ribosomal protein L4 [Desulfobacteraceae bacterium A6]